MKRKSQASSEGSLDLLLDTMCNAFGGIVLIAILVALLVEKPGEDAEATVGNVEDARLLDQKQREWKQIEPRLEEIESKMEEMGEKVELIRRREELAATVAEMQKDGAQTMNEMSDRLGKAQAEQAAEEERAAELAEEIATLEQAKDSTKRQMEELENQEDELVNARKQELKPPEATSSVGQQFNFIIRYGQVYPVQLFTKDASGIITEVRYNEEMIAMDGDTANPIQGRGLDVVRDRERLAAMIRSLGGINASFANEPEKGFYIASLVYSDSFAILPELERLIHEVGGVPSGWEPYPEDAKISFGGGTRVDTQR